MTPLAHEIVKDSLLPVRSRQHAAAAQDLRLLDAVHFFECSAVWPAARDLGEAMIRRGYSETLAFLPAPRTAIEIRDENGERALFLLEASGTIARVKAATNARGNVVSGMFCLMPLQGHPRLQDGAVDASAYGPPTQAARMRGAIYRAALYGVLAMINTPRVILSRQHMPHAGLQRQLIAARKIAGKYPLLAWSEVLLKVRPPDIPEGEQEAHLTGTKALHFCRQHLRIRLGRLELVTAHWRGDPALGIKRTRYRVVQ